MMIAAVVGVGALGIALLPWREQDREDTVTGLRILAANLLVLALLVVRR